MKIYADICREIYAGICRNMHVNNMQLHVSYMQIYVLYADICMRRYMQKYSIKYMQKSAENLQKICKTMHRPSQYGS
jgi:hypothetical protein